MVLVTLALFQNPDWDMFQRQRIWCDSLERLSMVQVMQLAKEASRIIINFRKCRIAEYTCSYCVYLCRINHLFSVGNMRISVFNNTSKQKCIVLKQLMRCVDHTDNFWDLVSFLFLKWVDGSRHKTTSLGYDLNCCGLRDILLWPRHEQDTRTQSLCTDLSVEASPFLIIPKYLQTSLQTTHSFRERISPDT